MKIYANRRDGLSCLSLVRVQDWHIALYCFLAQMGSICFTQIHRRLRSCSDNWVALLSMFTAPCIYGYETHIARRPLRHTEAKTGSAP